MGPPISHSRDRRAQLIAAVAALGVAASLMVPLVFPFLVAFLASRPWAWGASSLSERPAALHVLGASPDVGTGVGQDSAIGAVADSGPDQPQLSARGIRRAGGEHLRTALVGFVLTVCALCVLLIFYVAVFV